VLHNALMTLLLFQGKCTLSVHAQTSNRAPIGKRFSFRYAIGCPISGSMLPMMAPQKMAASESADPRIQRSLAALRGALLELLVKKAFEQTSITEITARAGLSYTTFFRHFDSKEALLNDVAAEQIQDLFSLSVPIVSRAGSFESCRALCAYVHERRDLWRSLLIGGAANIVHTEFVRQARDWAPGSGWKHNWLPVDLATLWSARSTIHILSWWLEQDSGPPVDEMALILDRLVLRSLSIDYSIQPRKVSIKR
jgi:AcrR family transcriptional regulator